MPLNYYTLLGVAYDDPPERIRAVYRQIIRAMHPDVAGEAQARAFQAYTEAYRTLVNADRRLLHNRALGIFVQPRPLRPGIGLHQRLYLTPDQAAAGGTFSLRFTRYDPCPRCWGSGCARCDGQGAIGEVVEKTVEVEPGLRDGATLYYEGEGAQGEPGGVRGPLFVYVSYRSP